MQKVIINVPDGYEVQIVKKEEEDKENKKDTKIRTYKDLINNKIEVKGYYITNISNINDANGFANDSNKNIALSEKVAKSMLAMAMISQLMPYYGGEITDEEWNDNYKSSKYVITKQGNNCIDVNEYFARYHFLAFHTAEQRDEFLKYNEQLVKDYLMID